MRPSSSSKGHLVFVNASGEAMLDQGKILRRRKDALSAVVAEADHGLRDFFTASEKGDVSVGTSGVAVPLSSSPTDRWFAHVLPLTSGARREAGSRFDATAAVFVRKTSLANPNPLEELAKLYRLTVSEIRTLDAVTKVTGTKAIAEMLGVSQA
jgi:hypothetical protein